MNQTPLHVKIKATIQEPNQKD